MYKILYLFTMKTLEVYLVPGTASGFFSMATFRLMSANGKKLKKNQYYNTIHTTKTPNITNIHVLIQTIKLKTLRDYLLVWDRNICIF